MCIYEGKGGWIEEGKEEEEKGRTRNNKSGRINSKETRGKRRPRKKKENTKGALKIMKMEEG